MSISQFQFGKLGSVNALTKAAAPWGSIAKGLLGAGKSVGMRGANMLGRAGAAAGGRGMARTSAALGRASGAMQAGARGAGQAAKSVNKLGLRGAMAPSLESAAAKLQPLATSRMSGAKFGAGLGAGIGSVGGAYSGFKEDGLTGALRGGISGGIGGALAGGAAGAAGLKNLAGGAQTGLRNLKISPSMRPTMNAMR